MAIEDHHAFLFPLSLRPDDLTVDEQISQARYRELVDYFEKEIALTGAPPDVNAALGKRRKRSAQDFGDYDLMRLAFRNSRVQMRESEDHRYLGCERKYRQITTRNDRRYLCDQIQGLRRVFRDYLFEDTSHLDMVNCHYSLIMGFVRRMYPEDSGRFDQLADFLVHRGQYFQDLRLFTGEQCTADECKQLVASFLMGASLLSWAARIPCAYDTIPARIRNLHACITDLRSFLSSRPELQRFRPPSHSRMDAFECTNVTLYMLLTTLESQHVIVLRQVLADEFQIAVRAIIHDAVEIDGSFSGSDLDQSCDLLGRLRPHLREKGFYDEVRLSFKDKETSIETVQRLIADQEKQIEESLGQQSRSSVPLSLKLSNVPNECLHPTYLTIKTRLETEFGLCRVLTSYYMKTMDMEGQLSYTKRGYEPKEMKTMLENYRIRVSPKKEEAFFTIWTRDPSMQTYSHAVLFPSKSCPIPDALNLWNGFAVERFSLSDEDRKNSEFLELKEHFFRHLRYLVDDDAHAAYWMVYLAHLFQHPEQKPGICMVLQSDTEGVGKGLFESILRSMVGEDLSWYSNTPEDNLFGSFQDIMYHKLLGVIDESNVTKSKSVERFKALITNESVSITRKYHGAATVRDFHRFILTTNQTMPSVVSATDRRFMISRTKNAAIAPESINKLVAIKQSRVIMRLIYEDLMRMEIPIDFKFSTGRPTSDFYKEIQTLSRPTTLMFFDSWLSERLSTALNAHPATSTSFIPPNDSRAHVPSQRFLSKLPRPSFVRISLKELYEAYTDFVKTSGFKAECTLSSSRFASEMRNHFNASIDAEAMDHGIWYHKVFNRGDPYYQKFVWDMELCDLIRFLVETGALRACDYDSVL